MKDIVRFRVVVFDFDGTLADTLGWAANQMPGISARYRTRNVEPEEYDHIRALPPKELLSYLEISTWKMPLIMWELRRKMRRDTARLELFPGIAGVLLDMANRGIRLAVLSSNAEKNIRAVLGPELEPLFSHYQCGASFFGKKGKLQRLLDKADADHRDVMYVGDELRDLEAAEAVGVAFGAACWGLNSKETFERYTPFGIFTQPGDIGSAVISG